MHLHATKATSFCEFVDAVLMEVPNSRLCLLTTLSTEAVCSLLTYSHGAMHQISGVPDQYLVAGQPSFIVSVGAAVLR